MASDGMILPVGKLPLDLLSKVIDEVGEAARDPDLIVGPGIGEDAAVVRFAGEMMVVKTDPITFATDAIGWYLVCVNANDVASMGADPRWMLATLLLPEHRATREMVISIARQIAKACLQFDITFCGGHTEVTAGLDRPIAIGTMIGKLDRPPITSSGARPGDILLMSKRPAIEATSIIARERGKELSGRIPPEVIEKAKGMLFEPGISAVREARAVREMEGIHAMHDLTEGGLYNGIVEICIRSRVNAIVYPEKIKLYPETERLCRIFNIDPLGAISSGSLLMAVSPDRVDEILEAIRSAGVECDVIGEFTEGKGEAYIKDRYGIRPIRYLESDEITKI
ncbi:TPA: hydrogenase expression protein [Candidatus Poribacteria bacterium]|nr:hydrogenase expression protein [Candidatus Poribacteria bacterium]HEX29191.1 hydrogenase expression protein [Candidatus Poribacteria bacterium]